MQLASVDISTIQHYGKYLLNEYRDACHSFEEAAQALCENFYQEFRTDANEPELALVRVFRSMKYDELPPKLKAKATTHHPQLALMGTMGLEENWSSRKYSEKRQLIPINDKMSPMFQGVFNELGFSIADFHAESAAGHSVHSMQMLRYFHVLDASQSAAITDQASFVQPYGIKSVLAIGSQFLSRQSYVLIAFSRSPIAEKQAEILAEIAPHVSTLLAIFDGRKALWSS